MFQDLKNSSELIPRSWRPPNYLSKLCISLLTKLPWSLSQASTDHHSDVFVFVLLLSEGWAGETWELSKVMLFPHPPPSSRFEIGGCRLSHDFFLRLLFYSFSRPQSAKFVLHKYCAEDGYDYFVLLCRVWTVFVFWPSMWNMVLCVCVHCFCFGFLFWTECICGFVSGHKKCQSRVPVRNWQVQPLASLRRVLCSGTDAEITAWLYRVFPQTAWTPWPDTAMRPIICCWSAVISLATHFILQFGNSVDLFSDWVSHGLHFIDIMPMQ
jgi:hypothetical protein